MSTPAEAIMAIAEKFDWDQIAGGPVSDELYLAEYERIKPLDEKFMLMFNADCEIVAATIKTGDSIGRIPEDKTPDEMFAMVVRAMVTL